MTTQKERLANTERAISDALVTVGQTKPLALISISDLSRASGINRGTFYLHYLDKDDLVTQIRDRLTTQIQTILDTKITGTMNYKQLATSEPYPIVVDIVALINRNRRLVHFLLGPNGDSQFKPDVTARLEKAIFQELYRVKGTPNFRTDVPNTYAIRLIINVIMTIVQTWLDSDDGMTEADIAKLIMQSLYLSPYKMLGIDSETKA
ncbi:TetR/AcrR family transcriptional regulator [Lacticaseibacillus pabuli]|uniref:TetR/AcrR family transcriptional regulator n=1 Tax=Lacticaseibacillus pabuli TaxID=3025672 RepID=A0ABY7WXH1_9LACO|nr:TetR/AcrR family transcriptional regulator [Lacticaseibacillus sp. KACC 23028]WDF83769.1 TetR/AcrR family transcriptional regulator [Lacticaseibacillus sp. KACC 23028]